MKTNKFDLLSPKQVEAEYGIPVGTQAIWRCTRRYPIPYIKLGRLVRYNRSAVETWLESRTINGEGTKGGLYDWD
jgi:predicted DNA-binding transcriptional regulator AlpA